MKQDFNIPKRIYLYNEGIKELNFKSVEAFLKKNFGRIPVRLIRLKEKVVRTKGIIFDFVNTSRAFEQLKTSRVKEACHIILTDKIFATLSPDRHIHVRASIYSFPSIISTSGIVEGPAKPREYYFYKQKYAWMGAWDTEEAKLKKKFKNRFIDYRDKRINEVIKGYIAQALFFYIAGEPFCKQKSCRLFNAHWQEDSVYSQIKIGKFCPEHKKLLKQIKST